MHQKSGLEFCQKIWDTHIIFFAPHTYYFVNVKLSQFKSQWFEVVKRSIWIEPTQPIPPGKWAKL